MVYYHDGLFAADVASPRVALNTMYRRRSAEKSGRFLKSQVGETPLRAADIQGRARPGDESFLNSLHQFGGFLLLGMGAYLYGRSGDVDAWLQYHLADGAAALISSSLGVAPSSSGRRSCVCGWPNIPGDWGSRRLPMGRRAPFPGSTGLLGDGAEVPHAGFNLSIKAVQIPVFGAKNFWRICEFATSRGQIHLHMFAIWSGKHPHRFPQEMRNGGGAGLPNDPEDSVATWAWGSLSLAAIHPYKENGGPRRGPRPGFVRYLEASQRWKRRKSPPSGAHPLFANTAIRAKTRISSASSSPTSPSPIAKVPGRTRRAAPERNAGWEWARGGLRAIAIPLDGALAAFPPKRLNSAGTISWSFRGTSVGWRRIPPSIPSGGRPMGK